MREFRCDEELIKILKKYGYNDYSSKADKERNKQTFRKSKLSGRSIRFDRGTFKFWSGLGSGDDINSQVVNEVELKNILWYMNSTTADKNFITGDRFSVKDCQETYRALKREYNFYTIEYPKPKNLKRHKRLLDGYDTISFE